MCWGTISLLPIEHRGKTVKTLKFSPTDFSTNTQHVKNMWFLITVHSRAIIFKLLPSRPGGNLSVKNMCVRKVIKKFSSSPSYYLSTHFNLLVVHRHSRFSDGEWWAHSSRNDIHTQGGRDSEKCWKDFQTYIFFIEHKKREKMEHKESFEQMRTNFSL